MAAEKHIFPIFFLNIIARFLVLHHLELINLSIMFPDQNGLYFTFKFKMVTTSTQIKTFPMYVNYDIINNICLLET